MKEMDQRLAKNPNEREEKNIINKLKEKIKNLTTEKDTLKKKEMKKHQRLVATQRKIYEL